VYDPELRSWIASLPPPPSKSGGGPFFSSPAVASHADSVWIIGGSGGETGEAGGSQTENQDCCELIFLPRIFGRILKDQAPVVSTE
jgi:hypothetical protein